MNNIFDMIYDFDEMKDHVGHKIKCVGDDKNVVIKCQTCNRVLVNLDKGDELRKELAEDKGKIISHVWSIDDVIMRGKDRDIEITEVQAMEILEKIDRHKDASIGINWDVIDAAIEDTIDIDYLEEN